MLRGKLCHPTLQHSMQGMRSEVGKGEQERKPAPLLRKQKVLLFFFFPRNVLVDVWVEASTFQGFCYHLALL